jgi:hypothetical protein
LHTPQDAPDTDARALLMQSSGHWPDLRRVAGTLREQVWITLLQLLRLPRSSHDNPHLNLESQNGDTTVTLQVEEDLLFSALREHLPDDPAWDILGSWKQQVKEIEWLLHALCQWVMEQPDLQDLPLIPPGQPVWNSSGLTEAYAKTVVFDSVDYVSRHGTYDALPRRAMEQDYKVEPPSEELLHWRLNTIVSYVIAVDDNRGNLERLKSLHMKFQREIGDIPQFQAAVEAIQNLVRLKKTLEQELTRIEHLAKFPATCRLCTG